MKKFSLILCFLFSSVGCIASDSLAQIEDKNVNFVLNKLAILLEHSDPKVFPAITRIVTIPDRNDKCEWISQSKNIPTSVIEDGCPNKELLLTLTHWDAEPEFYTFSLGSALSWSITSYEVTERKNMSHWDAVLILQMQLVNEHGVYEVPVSFKVKNRGDVYTVNLK